MTDPSHSTPPDEIDDAVERASFVSARQHVGAAGFAQRDVLEQIIAAGQEQLAFTQSLRQVVASTLEQLRALPVKDLPDAAQTHLGALQDIVASGQQQIETATQLRQTIQRALDEVRNTPLEHVSAYVLSTLKDAVHQQVSDLQEIIGVAIDEAATTEQIAQLQQVSADAAQRVLAGQHAREERELAELDRLGQEALEKIRHLEAQGQTHEAQRTTLEGEAQTAQGEIERLEATNVQEQAEIARMEREQVETVERLTELQTTAGALREKTQRLADSLKIQQHQEQAFEDDPASGGQA